MTAFTADAMDGVSFLFGETRLPLLDNSGATALVPLIDEPAAAPLKKKRDTKRIGDLSEARGKST